MHVVCLGLGADVSAIISSIYKHIYSMIGVFFHSDAYAHKHTYTQTFCGTLCTPQHCLPDSTMPSIRGRATVHTHFAPIRGARHPNARLNLYKWFVLGRVA